MEVLKLELIQLVVIVFVKFAFKLDAAGVRTNVC